MSICEHFERGNENRHYDGVHLVDISYDRDCCNHPESDFKLPVGKGVKCKGNLGLCKMKLEDQ